MRSGDLLAEEAAWGVGEVDFYFGFGEKVERLRRELLTLLNDLKSQGKSIAVYGASAKGQHAAQLLPHRSRDARFRRRQKHGQARAFHAGHASADSRARKIARSDARLRAAADVELRRRDSRTTGGIPSARRTLHHSDTRCESGLTTGDRRVVNERQKVARQSGVRRWVGLSQVEHQQ